MSLPTFTLVPLDTKRAPRAPKLVPAFKRHVDELEKVRAYGKERVVRAVDTPRGQLLWHLDGGHRLAWADTAGARILGSIETRRVDAASKERGSIAISSDASRVLFTDRVTVYELDLTSGAVRVVWREERDDLEPGPREAAYVGDAIVVSTVDALWLLAPDADGTFLPAAVAPLEGFSHMASLPDGAGVLVCTYACEEGRPAARVFHVVGRSLRCVAQHDEKLTEPATSGDRLYAKAGKQTVEIADLPARDATSDAAPSAAGEGPVRLRATSAPVATLASAGVIAEAPIPGAGRLVAIEAAGGHRVAELSAGGEERRAFALPPGLYAQLAVSPDGSRAIVSARRRIERLEAPRSFLLDLSSGTCAPFGATTVHAFVSNETVLAGVALMDVAAPASVPEGLGLHATRPIKGTVALPGHRAKPRAVAIDRARGRALIQTNHGDGVLVAITPTSVRVVGVTPRRAAAVYCDATGALCVLADGEHYCVEIEGD